MNLGIQAAALAMAGAVAGIAVIGARLLAWRARSRGGPSALGSVGAPQILFFTTDECSTCKVLQEPALRDLEVSVRRVDAIREADLTSRFSILTVPSTVVIGADGRVGAVNYGYASAAKLCRQLRSATA